jgi:hypothetical protein
MYGYPGYGFNVSWFKLVVLWCQIAHVFYLTLYVARFAALLTDIITVGTSVRTNQSTTTIHTTAKSVESA